MTVREDILEYRVPMLQRKGTEEIVVLPFRWRPHLEIGSKSLAWTASWDPDDFRRIVWMVACKIFIWELSWY